MRTIHHRSSRLAGRLLPAITVSVVVMASVVAWPSSAHPQDAPAAAANSPEFEAMRARFEGVWQMTATPARGRQIVNRGIESAVSAMNFFVRAVARSQLEENTPINRRITFRFMNGNRIRVHFSQTNWTTTTVVGRTGRARSTDGDELRVTQRFRGETLEQVFETDEGTRWNTYSSTGEGTLRLAATTQGMMMPQPMRFSLDYQRQ